MAFCGYLRQSTAVDILLGPFLDDADGDTPDTDATLDVEVSKNGQALANKSDATVPVHDAAASVTGYYNCELDATDTGTLGILTVVAHHADDLPIRQDYQVVTAKWWDSMCSSATIDVNVTAMAANVITAASIAAAAIDNATFAADVGSTAYATNIIALAVRKALDEIKLDHLVAVADADDVVDSSIIAKLASSGATPDWSTFVNTTDSLQAARDKLTDIEADIATAQADLDTITGTGGVLIGTDAMDRSGTLDVNTKTVTAGIIETEVDNAMANTIPADGSITARSRDDFLLRSGAPSTGKMTINEGSGAYAVFKIDDEGTPELYGNTKAASGTIISGAGVTTRDPT
jgi:hypothetical protein